MKRGLTPFTLTPFTSVKIEHLLELGEQYPDLQRKISIVALGSVWKGWDETHDVTFLGSHYGRKLDRIGRWIDWDSDWWFAAIHEE